MLVIRHEFGWVSILINRLGLCILYSLCLSFSCNTSDFNHIHIYTGINKMVNKGCHTGVHFWHSVYFFVCAFKTSLGQTRLSFFHKWSTVKQNCLMVVKGNRSYFIQNRMCRQFSAGRGTTLLQCSQVHAWKRGLWAQHTQVHG